MFCTEISQNAPLSVLCRLRSKHTAEVLDVKVGHLQGLHLGQFLALLPSLLQPRHHGPQSLEGVVESVHPLALPGVGVSPPLLHPGRGQLQLLLFPSRQRLFRPGPGGGGDGGGGGGLTKRTELTLEVLRNSAVTGVVCEDVSVVVETLWLTGWCWVAWGLPCPTVGQVKTLSVGVDGGVILLLLVVLVVVELDARAVVLHVDSERSCSRLSQPPLSHLELTFSSARPPVIRRPAIGQPSPPGYWATLEISIGRTITVKPSEQLNITKEGWIGRLFLRI